MLLNKGVILGVLVLLLPTSTLFGDYFTFYDELFVAIVLVYSLLFNRSKIDKTLFVMYISILMIGFLSNIMYPIYPSAKSVVVDAFTCLKPITILIFLPFSLNEKEKKSTYTIFLSFARVYIVVTFLFGIISQFFDLGLTAGGRYGISAYTFFYNNHSGFGISVIAAIIILAASDIRNLIFTFYFTIASFTLLLTTKGVIYSFLLISFLLFIMGRSVKIKISHIIILAGFMVLISLFQIKTYFMNSESARMAFIGSSIILGSEFFPFGTGFATFGGKEAFENYSVLYERFGFEYIWGLSPSTGMFAHDNYMAMIIAQNGFIGYLLYLILLWLIFRKINNLPFSGKRLKVVIVAGLIMLYISSIATGVFKTDNGVFLASIISILLPPEHEIKQLQEAKLADVI